ncbi:MAG: ABC transporter substrate-binding protein [Burkholderiales bacterium]
MNRRDTVIALSALTAAALYSLPRSSLAQKPGRIPRVGILILASLPSVVTIIDGFRANLRDLGYVEGRSISIEVLSAEGNADRLPELAAQLVAGKVDLIVTGGGNVSTLAARKATATIPIVMTSSYSAVEAGLVQSLGRPGGNITGLTVPQELGLKQIQLLQEIIPSLSRVAVLVRHDPAMTQARERATASAQQMLLVTLQMFEARLPEDMLRALDAMRAAKPDALIVSPDPLLYQQREQILRFTRAAKIADMYSAPDIVDSGGLVAFSPSTQDIYRGVARYVDRLLKGAKPADLPVEQPTTFELVINLKTAKSLGLKIPQSVLLRADRVIE